MRPSSLPAGVGQRRATSGSARGAPSSLGSSGRGGGGASAGTLTVPTGRLEMLQWMGVVSGRSPYNHAASEAGGSSSGASAMEGLRDGLCYVLAFTNIIEETQGGGGSIVSEPKVVVSQCWATIRDRIDQNIHLAPSPSKDTIQVAGACERNFQVLQGMIREYLPKRMGTEMDTTKLSKGLLQEHMVLLKWMVGLWKRMLTASSAPQTMPGQQGAPRGSSAGITSRRTATPTAQAGQSRQAQQPPLQQHSATAASMRSPLASSRGGGGDEAVSDGSVVDTILQLEREVIQFEEEAMSVNDPANITADSIQAMIQERDLMSDTLEQVLEILMEGSGKQCPLRSELLRTLKIQ